MDLSESLNIGVAYTDDKVNEVSTGCWVLTFDLSDAHNRFNHTIKEVESTNVKLLLMKYVASHLIGATTFSVGYGEIEDGNKVHTVGARKKIGESF